MPSLRHVPPEPPEVRLRALLFRRRRDGDDVVVARVERARDAPDGAALAGRVVALERDDGRDVLEPLVAGELVQSALKERQLLFVVRFTHRLRQVELGEDVPPVDRRRARRRRTGGYGAPPAIEPGTHGVADRLADREVAESIVARLDERPGSFRRAGLAQHALAHLAVAGVLRVVLPVLAGHAPRRGGARLQLFEATPLRAFVRWSHSLSTSAPSSTSIRSKRTASWSSLARSAPRVRPWTRSAMGSLVPASEEDGRLALRGKRLPEAPHPGPLRHPVDGRAGGVDLDVPGIHPLEQEVGHVAAPAAVFAAKDDDDGTLGFRQHRELRFEQLVAHHR